LKASAATPRSTGAFAGNPLDGSSSTCFSESAGAVTGTGAAGCVGTPWLNSPRWEISLPIDRAGSWTVSVGIRGNGASGPICQAFGWDQLTSSVSQSAVATNSSPSFVIKSVQVPYVPNGGYLLLACDHLVDSSSAIGAINWIQP
jgi:hypothetical protein